MTTQKRQLRKQLRAQGLIPAISIPPGRIAGKVKPGTVQSQRQKTISTRTVDLSVARTKESPLILSMIGNVFFIPYFSHAGDWCHIRLGRNSDFMRVRFPFAITNVPFEEVAIANSALGAGHAIDVAALTAVKGEEVTLA